MSTLIERIDEVLRRIAAMGPWPRIPADPCDADLVLAECRDALLTEKARADAAVAQLTAERDAAVARSGAAELEMRQAQTFLAGFAQGVAIEVANLVTQREKAIAAEKERSDALRAAAQVHLENSAREKARADASEAREITALAAVAALRVALIEMRRSVEPNLVHPTVREAWRAAEYALLRAPLTDGWVPPERLEAFGERVKASCVAAIKDAGEPRYGCWQPGVPEDVVAKVDVAELLKGGA